MLKSRSVQFACVFIGGLLSGCSLPDLSIDNNPSTSIYGFPTMRRLYVNDSASNDSLPVSITGKGVKFVLQPGRNYTLRVHTGATGDVLNLLYLNANNNLQGFGTVTPQVADSEELFTVVGNPERATYFVGQIKINNVIRQSRSKIRLVPVDLVESGSLAVHLFLVGRLKSLSDSSAKGAFARNFLTRLRSLYSRYGVTLATSYEIVGPDTSVTVAFSGTFVSLPGTRIPGSAHLYLVDSISAGTTPVNGFILGFSPREVFDLYQDPNSRLILSVRGMLASGGNDSDLAITAAHELGHFFGLRHPSATAVDTANDHDQSNRDDGLASTSFCPVLSKKTAAPLSTPTIGPGDRPYCLYIASTTCPATCDLSNLMFAYQCNSAAQDTLTPEQQLLMRRNLALLQGR
jgi:hypothetical protein